jgi:phospholipid/cholesterol/gamma-HCH transport system substrate-binding protein
LGSLNSITAEVNEGLKGSESTSIGRTVKGLESSSRRMSDLLGHTDRHLQPVLANLGVVTSQIRQVTGDIKTVTAALSSPDSSVLAALDAKGPIYTNLSASIAALSGTMANVNKLSAMFPTEFSKAASFISDLNSALISAQKVSRALENNPLLKRGIPPDIQTSVSNPRNVEF